MDWLMLGAVIALLVAGVFFIYSASYRDTNTPVSDFYQKQMIWMLIGLVAYFVFSIVDYHRLRDISWPVYLVSTILLVLVLFIGYKIHGARRWFKVPGMLLQPSEFAKVTVILVLARFLGHPGRLMKDPKNMFRALLIMGIPFILIVKEPDLGTAMVLVPIVFIMLFVAGVPVKYLAMIGLAGLMLLPVGWFGLGDYQKERILVFFDPGRDPLGAGWNKLQSEIAVGSGGLTGKGYLNGTQNVLGFLPYDVAPTDFIFSVIAEETGFVGAIFVLALYAALLTAGVRAALGAREKFGRLLAIGVMTLVFSHVLVNVAMTIGLMPITGLPLPLISYGGSFMLSTMVSLGMVQSVYIRRVRH
jgi:rod shape determining protein RodA